MSHFHSVGAGYGNLIVFEFEASTGESSVGVGNSYCVKCLTDHFFEDVAVEGERLFGNYRRKVGEKTCFSASESEVC